MSDIERQELLKNIDKALDEVRPHLKVDGGDIEIVEITDELTVFVKWLGNCINCSMSAMTMKAGIEQTIKAKFPQIKEVKAVNGITV